MRIRNRLRPGFTLVEVLVVIAIIGILAGIVVGISGYATKKSDRGRALADIEEMRMALEEYRVAQGSYPQSATTDVTTLSVDGSSFSNALSKYDTSLRLVDPWGRPYRYYSASKFTYRLWSLGPDSAATNTADDIDSSRGEF